jgi:tetrahydrodipicolinate N-succinyltransferase
VGAKGVSVGAGVSVGGSGVLVGKGVSVGKGVLVGVQVAVNRGRGVLVGVAVIPDTPPRFSEQPNRTSTSRATRLNATRARRFIKVPSSWCGLWTPDVAGAPRGAQRDAG